jgi:hypothetical protein
MNTPINKVSALVDELDCHQIPCWKITDITDKACHLYVRRDQGDESDQLDNALYDVKQWLLSKPANDEKTRFTIEAVQLHPQEWQDMDIEEGDE